MLNLNDNPPKRKHRFLNFTCNSNVIKVESVTEHNKNFSAIAQKSSDIWEGLSNFALMDYIKEYDLTPALIFDKRMREIIDYVNNKSKSDVANNREILLGYINNFMYSQIMRLLDDGGLNLIIALGLSKYIDNLDSAKKLQVVLQKGYDKLASGGTMDSTIQKEIREHYSNLWKDLLLSVDEKYINPDKKGLLLGGA